MLRNLLLSALAAATLAGCATDYAYRGGNGGDYYYGQPRTEYRYHDPYGYSGGYYGGYYYDRYGRLVYVSPYGYGGYYGGPYYGYPYRQRPHREGDHHAPPPAQGSGGDNDRKPPWRNLDGLVPRRQDDPRLRPMPQREPGAMPMPRRDPPAPRLRGDGGGGSRIGGMIRRAKAGSEPGGE